MKNLNLLTFVFVALRITYVIDWSWLFVVMPTLVAIVYCLVRAVLTLLDTFLD